MRHFASAKYLVVLCVFGPTAAFADTPYISPCIEVAAMAAKENAPIFESLVASPVILLPEANPKKILEAIGIYPPPKEDLFQSAFKAQTNLTWDSRLNGPKAKSLYKTLKKIRNSPERLRDLIDTWFTLALGSLAATEQERAKQYLRVFNLNGSSKFYDPIYIEIIDAILESRASKSAPKVTAPPAPKKRPIRPMNGMEMRDYAYETLIKARFPLPIVTWILAALLNPRNLPYFLTGLTSALISESYFWNKHLSNPDNRVEAKRFWAGIKSKTVGRIPRFTIKLDSPSTAVEIQHPLEVPNSNYQEVKLLNAFSVLSSPIPLSALDARLKDLIEKSEPITLLEIYSLGINELQEFDQILDLLKIEQLQAAQGLTWKEKHDALLADFNWVEKTYEKISKIKSATGVQSQSELKEINNEIKQQVLKISLLLKGGSPELEYLKRHYEFSKLTNGNLILVKQRAIEYEAELQNVYQKTADLEFRRAIELILDRTQSLIYQLDSKTLAAFKENIAILGKSLLEVQAMRAVTHPAIQDQGLKSSIEALEHEIERDIEEITVPILEGNLTKYDQALQRLQALNIRSL